MKTQPNLQKQLHEKNNTTQSTKRRNKMSKSMKMKQHKVALVLMVLQN